MLARTDWIAGHSHDLSKHNDLVHRVCPESLVRADSLTVCVPFSRERPLWCSGVLFAARLTIVAAFRPPGYPLRSQATNQVDVCEPVEAIYLLSLPRQMSANVFFRRDP